MRKLRRWCILGMLLVIGCSMGACWKSESETKEDDSSVKEGKVETMSRETLNFNTEWLYAAQDYSNGELEELDDSKFEKISLPHSNILLTAHKGPEFQNQIESYRFISWYRRHFVLDKEYEEKRIFLEFEGVATVAQVYVNGQFAGEHKGAYTGFTLDITEYLNPCGEENVIAIRVDSKRHADIPPEGGSVDYCLFGGIVRDVWMIVTGNSYIENTFAMTPDIAHGSGKVNNTATIKNASAVDKQLTVETCLVDKEGKIMASAAKETVVPAGECVIVEMEMWQEGTPILWTTEEPYLYTVLTRVIDNGQCVDDNATRIGFRWFSFEKDGFYLNGEKMKLIGVNRHEQWAYFGRAVGNRHQEADADLVKETGFNAVRCSHYPQDPAFLDRCDEIGLIVFEEAPGWQYVGDEEWKEIYKTNIEEMIVRDRNHASIVSWGTRVNESLDDDDLYTETNALAKALDATRPTHGVRRMESYADSAFLEGEDIYTVNYRYPDVPKYTPFLITEHSMDWYDGNGFSWATAEKALKFTKSFAEVTEYYFKNEFCLGGFAWSMFDYNNEVNYTRTNHVFYSGMYDIFRTAKMPSYFYKSQKNGETDPMVYIADYWNGESKGTITVMSNCDEVELFINGRSIGRITSNLYPHLPHPLFEFKEVVYEEGEITAIGYRNGEEVARQTRRTPENAAKLILIPEDSVITADGSDFTAVRISLVDENGTVLPYSQNSVTVTVSGTGKFVGEEKLKLEAGQGTFYVVSEYQKTGTIWCEVAADGIESASCEISVTEFTEKTVPSVLTTGQVKPISSTWTEINDSQTGRGLNQFTYQGNGWNYCSQPGCYYADNHYSKTAGDTCMFRFEGTEVEVYASVAPGHGIMKLSIDGEEQWIDCYSEVRKDGVRVYASQKLAPGEHVIMITVSGKKNEKANDNYVTVDTIAFYQE